MLMFIPTSGIVLLIRFFAVITKYTFLDEQRREAKEGKSQRKNPRSITRGATFARDSKWGCRLLMTSLSMGHKTQPTNHLPSPKCTTENVDII